MPNDNGDLCFRQAAELLADLKPVEIIGDHWIHRPMHDIEAQFYRRSEVEEILMFIRRGLEAVKDRTR
jgi:hypothetical protein